MPPATHDTYRNIPPIHTTMYHLSIQPHTPNPKTLRKSHLGHHIEPTHTVIYHTSKPASFTNFTPIYYTAIHYCHVPPTHYTLYQRCMLSGLIHHNTIYHPFIPPYCRVLITHNPIYHQPMLPCATELIQQLCTMLNSQYKTHLNYDYKNADYDS